MSAAAAKDMELPSKHLEEVSRVADNIYHAIVNACSGSAGTFRFQPISWDYNNITKVSTQSNQQYQGSAGTGYQSRSKNTIPTIPNGGRKRGNSNKKKQV